VTEPRAIWTIGHSTRPLEEFLELLRENRIGAIADVRRLPGSRRHPQYDQDAFAASLAEHDIGYHWFEALGGRRRAHAGSPNTAWRNASFRGYADYMASAEFATGFVRLLELATRRRTAVMCAEAVWWRCHRGLLADALCVRGIEVLHILGAHDAQPHPYTSAATVIDGCLSYAAHPGDAGARQRELPYERT
jgi:uncharacterized protein (DUF488 family)